MSDPFGSLQLPKTGAIGLWPAEDPEALAILAETLETPVRGDQSGQYFCHPNGAIAVFARPIGNQPLLLTDFDLTGENVLGLCGRTP